MCLCVCLNSCNAAHQNSLVQMTLDLLFDVVTVAVDCNPVVFIASVYHGVIAVTSA